MCGRFYVPEEDIDDFAGLVNKIEKELLKKAGEIFPGNYAPVITPKHTSNSNTNNVHAIKWGFPGFKGKPVINARSETVRNKPMFMLPFLKRRCLIPARGFYEWKSTENSQKRIKHIISLFDSGMMYLAGIYWFFKDREGSRTPCFVILTTQANEDIKEIHDRMPVIIKDKDKDAWLSENSDINTIETLLKPLDKGLLKIQVSD
ncbi:MAG: SOS response-associated peptidase [Acetivibrionales bacterium]|jgi:putative SOS response-associated peptidase YedK